MDLAVISVNVELGWGLVLSRAGEAICVDSICLFPTDLAANVVHSVVDVPVLRHLSLIHI